MAKDSEQEMTLVSHLEALRSMLFRCLLVLGIGLVPAFVASPYVLDFFTEQMVLETGKSLHYFAPMEVFMLQLKIAAVLDCVVCFPLVAWNVWKFVLPALYERERKFVRSMIWMMSALFASGVVFCLWVCFPWIVRFGMSFSSHSVQAVLGVSQVMSFALSLSIAFGCMFQFPLVTYALVRSGIVRYQTICRARPYVLIAVLVLAALLTPPDVLSQLILGLPTYLLFELGLLASRRYRKRDNSR